MVRYLSTGRARPLLSDASGRARRTSQSGGVILSLPAFVLSGPPPVPRIETLYPRKRQRDVVIALMGPWVGGVGG